MLGKSRFVVLRGRFFESVHQQRPAPKLIIPKAPLTRFEFLPHLALVLLDETIALATRRQGHFQTPFAFLEQAHALFGLC